MNTPETVINWTLNATLEPVTLPSPVALFLSRVVDQTLLSKDEWFLYQ
jgi:hypothetical protein